jgi:hypothetical protein
MRKIIGTIGATPTTVILAVLAAGSLAAIGVFSSSHREEPATTSDPTAIVPDNVGPKTIPNFAQAEASGIVQPRSGDKPYVDPADGGCFVESQDVRQLTEFPASADEQRNQFVSAVAHESAEGNPLEFPASLPHLMLAPGALPAESSPQEALENAQRDLEQALATL